MAGNMSEEEYNEIKEVFNLFDADGDDAISTSDLGRVLEAYGKSPSLDELQNMIHEFDSRGAGKLSFNDFLNIVGPNAVYKTTSEMEIQEAFKIFDKDENGFISLEELKDVLTRLGEKLTDQEINEMFKEADTDSDGRLNYEEFAAMLSNK